MREIQIASPSGTLSATVFDSSKAGAVLVIASATGVKQSFYKKFATFISTHNITVITFDYSGIGRSLQQPIKEVASNAADWGRNDLESVIYYAIHNFPDSKRYVLGHSIGGQLIGLSKSALKMDKLLLVAAQSGYWKFWRGMGRTRMWCNWHLLFPILLNLFGYLPSKRISGMENLPKNMAKQWSHWGKRSEYIFSEIPVAQTVYNEFELAITAISIADDRFAPKKAVDWMTAKYTKAQTKSVHLVPSNFNTGAIGHFGIFREKFKDILWPLVLRELQ